MTKADIAVLGAGFSATAVVVNLLEYLHPERTIAVVGCQNGFGRGVAYATDDDAHRLNVPAGRMSLFADRPNDLIDWLARRGDAYGSDDFIPRRLFGAYVSDTLGQGIQRTDNRARVRFIDAQALRCHALEAERQIFELTNADVIEVGKSVLCLGGTAAGLPVVQGGVDAAVRDLVVENPWTCGWMDGLDIDAPVFIVGAGLTAVDQLVSLRKRGHAGPIHMLSRHALMPHAHVVPRSAAIESPISPGGKLSEMLNALRVAAARSEDWRSVVDGLRPVTQSLWQSMSIDERRRFLRHASGWWNIHRHRMAPDIAGVLDSMRASGQLVVHKGWLERVVREGQNAAVIYKDRHSRTSRRIAAQRVVNCTGMEKCSVARVPLLQDMLDKAFIRQDPLGLGLAVDEQSRIQSGAGMLDTGAYAMGPMTVGQFWEIFAVPDIRVQARDVAQRVATAA
ncbi:FAD/NAD(P)-binding protein [Rhizobium sp. KVB221]|uniref:FAD/NAD(P)-binding protein n=1 Tax=Rhizobium setariae TaxID=2801340 RepID=A0A936YL81_9HYPH|nr:FAD/NAD(P)-binding protein [Rhizobium setariae]MBL0372494.1 FAD/NAD(P)-binding protein [Rhizobium setariae]